MIRCWGWIPALCVPPCCVYIVCVEVVQGGSRLLPNCYPITGRNLFFTEDPSCHIFSTCANHDHRFHVGCFPFHWFIWRFRVRISSKIYMENAFFKKSFSKIVKNKMSRMSELWISIFYALEKSVFKIYLILYISREGFLHDEHKNNI